MKLLLENWRQYLNEGEKAVHYGDLYLFENDKVTKTSFYDALNTLSESDDDVNTFLENWEKSVDYQLGLLREEDSDAGPIWKLLYQSWALEQKFKAKAAEKIIAVSKKINDFAEKNPKTAKFAKYAVGGLLAGAAAYYIHNIVTKGGDASEVMELAQALQPEDPDLAREVVECAQDFGPEAVAEFMQGQSDTVEKAADALSTAGEPALEQAAQAADSVAQDVKQTEALDFWNDAFEKFDANQEQWKGDPGFFADADPTTGAEVANISPSQVADIASIPPWAEDPEVYNKYGPWGAELYDGDPAALETAAQKWDEFKNIANALEAGESLEDIGLSRSDFRLWARNSVYKPAGNLTPENYWKLFKSIVSGDYESYEAPTNFIGSIPPDYMKTLRKMMRASLKEGVLSERKRDQRPRKEPTPFKSKAQKRYKKKRKQNDIYSTVSGHKNLKSGAPFNTTPQRAGTDRLRFENMLLENIEGATRLSIFDFDETIAFTEGYINVIDKETGKEFQTKSQEEFDAIKDDDRYEFDFSPLDQVHNATENPSVTTIMRERLGDSDTQVMILTARAPISVDDIHRTLRTFDRPIETSDIIMIGVEGQNKGNYLANVVLSKYENIKEVEFYDDSQGNIDDMIQIKKELESIDRAIKFDIYLVKHGRPVLMSS